MMVLFKISIEGKDGSTWVQMEGDLPFKPTAGDQIRFCGANCCQGLVVSSITDGCVFSYQDKRFEVVMFDESRELLVDKIVNHYQLLGFVESKGSREMHEVANANRF